MFRPFHRLLLLCFALQASLVLSAINVDGSPAVEPASADNPDDPSPINDPSTYEPDQHDCPPPCVDYANTHSWIPYLSVQRLERCKAPMLLELSVSQPVDSKDSTIFIRTCTLNSHPTAARMPDGPAMKNPKKDTSLVDQVTSLLDGLKTFFEAKDNSVAAVYIGSGLGKSTHLNSNDDGDQPSRIFGVSVDTTGDLAAVQRAALGWSTGSCHDIPKASKTHPQTLSVQVFDLAAEDAELMSNRSAPAPTNAHASAHIGRGLTSRHSHIIHPDFRLKKRAECKPMQVQDGDTCTTLSVRCGIRGADFTKYNTKKDLCSNLEEGDYPKANADGSCKSHLIDNGDTCAGLAAKNKVTISDLSKWNDKTTWGLPPLPPPQKGATCGPTVPSTTRPKDSSTSMADLNPCPLRACCSNWGFCGVFPDHCKVNAPANGAPGSKKKGFQNTCVSNCGTDIKQNSGPPKAFSRIGYYAAFGRDRDCLRLKAKNANTDGSYTHIHWAFASIDPKTWKPVITQGKDQWSAIIQNRVLFATNLAQFAKDEGIDGIDIDWEYPGALDIMVGGSPIGEKSDGLNYLRFLTVLREKLASDKSVLIAAPASYWYLKQFPIDDIGKVIDYIVFMTYDLHGQWNYGNPNAFDECPSGKCIRSHGKLTALLKSEKPFS
ncbi:hypothetical protein BKA59DRAFT_491476 [Fusarium tricinctum]|uniref:chitinase n=1 Tax=Fusarium tricinctum TaxID=61284 RepID=A0A8K0S347_9HYPO|nr:hypothetical protein BKA59DRAFT_491476 [Fusarium tricinctum]